MTPGFSKDSRKRGKGKGDCQRELCLVRPFLSNAGQKMTVVDIGDLMVVADLQYSF